MKQFYCLVLCLCEALSVIAQMGYLDYEERVLLPHGSLGLTTVSRNIVLTDSLTISEIGNGGKAFLYDRGLKYYRRHALWRDRKDSEISTPSFLSAYKEYQHQMELCNLGLNCRLFDDCNKSIESTELYLQALHEDQAFDSKQIYCRYKHCQEKE